MGTRHTHPTGADMIRSPYQGLLEIFHYNRPFYVRTFAGVIAAVTVSMWLPLTLRALLLVAAGTAVFWTCSSLLVSHYVYDRSGFYSLQWLPACLSRPPVRWIDIYDPREMTEPSIGQARRIAAAPSTTADWRALPARDQEFDTAFLIFAAHELRHQEARVQLFREVARALRVGGELVLVEHSRDWANFLAYGPGFLHFFSQRTWQKAANAAGLSIRKHRTMTPFVHVFIFGRPS